jgi:hypothetical protein
MKFYFLYIEEMRLENKDNTQAVENTRIAAGRVAQVVEHLPSKREAVKS